MKEFYNNNEKINLPCRQDCKTIIQTLNEIIGNLISAMEIQEKRESSEFHLTSEAFKPIWDSAKDEGKIYLDYIN